VRVKDKVKEKGKEKVRVKVRVRLKAKVRVKRNPWFMPLVRGALPIRIQRAATEVYLRRFIIRPILPVQMYLWRREPVNFRL